MKAIDEDGTSFKLWQRRMGHANRCVTQKMLYNDCYGTKASLNLEEPTYEACVQANATKQPNDGDLVEGSLENTIISDVRGSFKKPKAGGKRLFVSFTVIPHRYVRLLLIDSRVEIPAQCRNFIARFDETA